MTNGEEVCWRSRCLRSSPARGTFRSDLPTLSRAGGPPARRADCTDSRLAVSGFCSFLCIVLAPEMTGSVSMLLPMLCACAMAMLVPTLATRSAHLCVAPRARLAARYTRCEIWRLLKDHFF